MVNDECLNRTASTGYLETESVYHAMDGGDDVAVAGIICRQIEIVGTGNSGFIQNGNSEIPAKPLREVISGGVDTLSLAIGDSTLLYNHNRPRISGRVFGRFELERFAAAGENKHFSFLCLKVEFKAEAIAQQALKHESLFSRRFHVGNSDLARRRSFRWNGVYLEPLRSCRVSDACDLIVLEIERILREHRNGSAKEDAPSRLTIEAGFPIRTRNRWFYRSRVKGRQIIGNGAGLQRGCCRRNREERREKKNG